MGTTLTLVDGTDSLVIRPSQPTNVDPLFCGTWDIGFPEPREDVEESADRSGMDDLTFLHNGRTITLALSVLGDLDLNRHEYVEVLRQYCRPSRRPYLYIQPDGIAQARRTLLRAHPMSCVVGQTGAAILEVALSFTSPSGVFESVTSWDATLYPSGTGSGRVYSEVYNKTFPSGATGSAIVVTAQGSADAPFTFRVYGGCSNPSLQNLASGKQLTFAGYNLPVGKYVDIDTYARTAIDDTGVNVNKYIDWTVSSWLALVPGENQLLFTATSPDTVCVGLLNWRDWWV